MKTSRRGGWGWWVASAAVACGAFAACGDDGAACVPGKQESCGCPGGSPGVQVCNADGTGFGACECGEGSTTGASVTSSTSDTSSASSASSSTGTGGSAPCAPGAVEACYEGPAGTENVGPCTGGTRICDVTGMFGACMGQTLPGQEDCATAIDEDCDGATPACAASWTWVVGNESQVIRSVIDPAGNLYVVGNFNGMVDFGGGFTLTAIGQGMYVAKLGPDGVPDYAIALDDPIDVTTFDGGMVVDANGNLYFSFLFTGSQTLLGTPVVSEGKVDAGLAKLAPDGSVLWFDTYGSPQYDRISNLALDTSGNLIATVDTNGSLYFGGLDVLGPGRSLVKLDGDGVFIRNVHLFDGNIMPILVDVVPGTDEVVLVASFPNVVDFGAGPVNGAVNGTLAVRLDADLTVVDYAAFGGTTNYSSPLRLHVLPGGGSVLLGKLEGSTFDVPPLVPLQLPANGGPGLYLVELDAAFQATSAIAYASSNSANARLDARDLVLRPNGNALLVGTVHGTLAPDLGAITDAGFLVELDATTNYTTSIGAAMQVAGDLVAPYAVNVAPDGVPLVGGFYYGGPHVFGGATLPQVSPGTGAFVTRFAP